MPISTAPALLIGIGARILLDHFSRSEGPVIKDFILVGTWQGVALHYASKNSGTSGFGFVVAFGVAAKLFVEFNLDTDVSKCLATILGVALGVLFTDFISQYFDKSPASAQRKKTQTTSAPAKSERKRERLVQFKPSVQGGSVETLSLLERDANSIFISDITSVDSNSDKAGAGPSSSLSPLEREIHVLKTRAALADSERRRCKEERKWAVSQGNPARASQMKWEVKRYTALMETFNHEAEVKISELASTSRQLDQTNSKKSPPTSKDKASRLTRDGTSNGRGTHKLGHKRSTRQINSRDANG